MPDLDKSKSRVSRGKGGRPKLDDLSETVVMHIRVSRSEKNEIDKTAAELGISTSELLRRLMREAAGHGPSYFEDGIKAIENLLIDVRAMGRDMNIIARGVNLNRVKIDGPTLKELRMIHKQLHLMKLLLGRTVKRARTKVLRVKK